jgi:hypothetical protein
MSTYIPMTDAFRDKTTDWVYTTLPALTYEQIAGRGIVLWCEENLTGRWTMLGGNKFGFEDRGDAMSFKLHFGF